MADDQRPSAKTETARKPEPARFSPEEFDLLVESGVAERLGRFELRRGELYRMNAEYAPHTRMKMALIFALKTTVAKQDWILRSPPKALSDLATSCLCRMSFS